MNFNNQAHYALNKMRCVLKTKPQAASALPIWLDYLAQLHPSAIELGLERIQRVASNLAVLKPNYYVITVGGTNGKGTTCRMLETILLESGYRVGVYSSPHLRYYNERVRINNQNPTDEQFILAFDTIEQQRHTTLLTYFEFTTLAALLLFKQADLDVVILEVGLGGRLDATNIIDADIAVITAVDIDHVKWLGDNRESIGFEKAGIFRRGGKAVIGDPATPQSIITWAKELDTKLYCVAPNPHAHWSYSITEKTWCFFSDKQRYSHLPLPHIPIANAATALATLTYSTLKISEKAVSAAMRSTSLLGRMQAIKNDPLVIVDVAHNPHAACYLNQQIQGMMTKRTGNVALRFVIGMCGDKDIAATLNALSANYWYCGSLPGSRGASANDLAKFLPQHCTKTFPSILAAWQCALTEATKDDIIVVCGSFHTVAEVMETIDYA